MNGLNKRKFRSLSTCMMVTALAAAPFAYGAPVTQFNSFNAGASGNNCDDFSCGSWFEIEVSHDTLGNASVFLFINNYVPIEQHLYCNWQSASAAAFLNIISVNPGNGTVSFRVTVDPSDWHCSMWGTSFDAPFNIDVSGQFNGTEDRHENGVGMGTNELGAHKYNFQRDEFSETFSGMIGLSPGPWAGGAGVTKRREVRNE